MVLKHKVAEQFGQYLDADDFEAVKRLISQDCEYEIAGEVLIGPDQIVDLYESNMKEGQQKFDELVWGKSYVKQLDENRYEVYFSDFLKHQGVSHNYKCKQELQLNEEGKIVEIIHKELPGERELLEAFYAQVGLSKNKNE